MNRTILIVEDNSVERAVMTEFLESEYTILEAQNEEEAIKILAESSKSISAVIMDIMLPETDGYEMLKKIKENPDWLSIPVIVTAGLNDNESQEKAIACGADNFVTKPYTRSLLLCVVKNAIKLKETAAFSNLTWRDKLTGLLTRDAFFAEAERSIARHEPGYYVLSCFNIENFKVINDQYGKEIGDMVLKHIAECLGTFFAKRDGLACRYSGDWFAILYPISLINSPELKDNHRKTMKPDCIVGSIRIRIGRYAVTDKTIPINIMFDRASLAESTIKNRFDTYIADYSEDMREALLNEQNITNNMSSALENGEFIPYFQPQFNHSTGALIGAEALVRWEKDGKFISPAEFVPIFERNGFIYEMDKYVWEQVCIILRRWIDEGRNPLPVSVNISRRDIHHKHFISVITDIIDKYKIPYDLLRLEITESAMGESSVIEKVGELIKLGFTVEIDDFGNGYSSLNTLKDVPASILKLDMRFFEKSGNTQRGGSILESVVRMAKWLGMSVIAEGVEDQAQADYMKSIGCYYIQGYLYAKPMPVSEYEKILANKEQEPKLSRMQTIDALNNNLFWDPKSMETLIFNSYIGGACIFEMHNDVPELMRINDQYIDEFGGLIPKDAELKACSIVHFLDNANFTILKAMLKKADTEDREASCEIKLTNGTQTEYVRYTARVIARTGERTLYYAVIVNETELREAEAKQKESTKRLAVIMENVNGGVSALQVFENGTSNLIFHNDKYFELFGYTGEEAEALHFDPLSCILPESFPYVMEKFKKLKADGKPIIIDYAISKADGSVAYIRANCARMDMDGYGQIITSVLVDVTEQRTLQDQLSAIVDNINGGVTAVQYKDGKAEFLLINNNYYDIIGYTKEQFETEVKDRFLLIHPDDRERIRKLSIAATEQQTSYTMEYKILRRNGAVRHILCNTNVMHLFGIKEPVQLSVINDITGLRRAEEQSLEWADRLKAVMNAMTNGITAVTISGRRIRFLFANDRYYQLHCIENKGDGQEELRRVLETIHPDDRDSIRDIVLNTSNVGQNVKTEYRVILPNGAIRYVKAEITVTKILGIDEAVQVSIYTDVTNEKKAEEQLRFLNESARDILSQPDSEKAIRGTLKKLMDYFEGERTYIFELNDETQTSNNTYELCAPGVTAELERLQNVPYETQQYWFDIFKETGFVTMSDVASIDDSKADMRDLLLVQNIRSIIVAPLLRDDKLIGYIGVDNPTKALDQVSQLIALADYIAVLLTRRDLIKTVEHERHTVQQLMDDTPGGFLRLEIFADKPPVIATVNDGFCKLLSMTREEIFEAYGDDVFSCLASDDSTTAHEIIANAYSSHGQFTHSFRLFKKNGEYVWVMLFGRFSTDENGKLFLNSYFTDITEKQTEEENQKALLDNLPFGAAMYEFDGSKLTVIHINRKYWQLVGREPIEYNELSVTDAIQEEDREIALQEIVAAIRQNRSAAVDLRILNGNGGYYPFRVTASIVPKNTGKYLLCVAYSPISEEAMSLQEMLPIALSTIVSNTEDISYVKDKDLRYICVSRAVADMVGAKNPRDLVGKTAAEVFSETFAEKFNTDDRNVIETGKTVLRTLEHIPTADGGVCLARTSKFPILDSRGNAVGVYCVSRDITAQKEKESQLELLTASLPGGLAAYSISDEGFKTLYFNDGYYDYSGYSREEYVEMTLREPLALMLPEDRPTLLALVRDFSKNRIDGLKGECSYRCLTRDGEIRYMSMKAVLSQVGEKHFVLNVVQLDVTTQMMAEKKQIELLDNLPFGAGMYEYDGKELTTYHLNKQYEIMVKRHKSSSNSAVLPLDFVHEEDKRIVLDELRDAIAHNRNASCVVRLLFGDEEYKPFRLDASIKKENNGKYMLFVAYSRISEEEQSFENMLPHMFDTIMESSTDLAFAKDVNFRYIRCSKTFADILGLASEKNVIGKTDYELFPKDVADMFRRDDSMLFADGKPQIDVDEAIPSPDGTLHYTKTSKHLLRDTAGNTIGVYCIGRDVTETREAFAQLKLLTNTIPGGIATFRCMPGNIETLYFSDGVSTLAGYTREEYQQNKIPPLSFVFDEDRGIIKKQIELLKSGETTLDFTFRIHTHNGEYKWINGNAHATNRVGDVFTVSAVLTDVTEAQEERERLYRTEEEYRIAASHSDRVICRYRISTMTLTATKETSTRLKIPEVLENIPYGEANLAEISEETKQAYLQFFEGIIHGEKECSVCFKKQINNSWRWLDARATTVFDELGKPVSAVISYNDITDLREKEAIYSRWQNSLSERTDESYTLFRANLSKGVSFESRSGTLLDVVYTNTECSFDELTAKYIEQKVYADDRERYRAFLRADTMLAEYMRGHRSDSLEYRELLPDGAYRWLKLSVDLVKYPDSDDIEVYLMYENIDERKKTELLTIERAETDALTGLLNRAAFAVRVNQTIGMSTSGQRHALLMMDIDGFKLVNDIFGHGAGDAALMDIADLLTKATRREDLVGRLGGDEFLIFLSDINSDEAVELIARKICEITRKTFNIDVRISSSIGIAIYPKDGEGFESLYKTADEMLYRVKDTGKDGYSFSQGEPVTELEIHRGIGLINQPAKIKQNKRRMLIVDDSKIDRAIVSGFFNKEYTVEQAEDGASAIRLLRHYGTAISVVLLDLMMPGMSGLEVLKKMQENDSTRTVPVIMISADENRKTALDVIKAGATDLITKPVDQELLRIRVEAAISRAENERLRAQNSFLSLRNTQTGSFRAALEYSGIIVITLDWITGEYLYSPGIETRLAGVYDGSGFWRILLSEMVTDSLTVQKMQQLVHDLAISREKKEDGFTVRLKTPSGLSHIFDFRAFKETNDYGLADKIIMTLRELNRNNA